MNILEIGLVFTICLILALLTYAKGMLNLSGAAAAFITGVILGIQGGILWILLLLLFLFSAFLATRYKFSYKEEKGFQEGIKGERGARNVLANGLIPLAIALFHQPMYYDNILGIGFIPHDIATFLFITSVASAASDTLASEMGIVSDKVYLITDLKKVKPGTNGGVSLLGQFWSFFGALYTFAVAYTLFGLLEYSSMSTRWILFGITMSFISCQIDSVLGATLERKNIIGKSTVNTVAIMTTVITTGLIIWLINL